MYVICMSVCMYVCVFVFMYVFIFLSVSLYVRLPFSHTPFIRYHTRAGHWWVPRPPLDVTHCLLSSLYEFIYHHAALELLAHVIQLVSSSQYHGEES